MPDDLFRHAREQEFVEAHQRLRDAYLYAPKGKREERLQALQDCVHAELRAEVGHG